MNLKFKATERKIRSYDAKMFSLRIDIKELTEKLKVEKAKTQLYHKGSNDILIEDWSWTEYHIVDVLEFKIKVNFLRKKLGVCILQGKECWKHTLDLIWILHESIIKLTRTCYTLSSC